MSSAASTPRVEHELSESLGTARRRSLKRSPDVPAGELVGERTPGSGSLLDDAAAFGSKRSKQSPVPRERVYAVPQASHLHGRVRDLAAFWDQSPLK